MMPESTSVQTLEFHELAPLLADPEPMWVALVSLGPSSANDPTVDAVGGEVERRLQENLRDYDELYRLPNGLFAVVLRTLADTAAITPRLERLFDAVKLPYVIGGHRHQYRVLFGAAIRWPEEAVDSLLNRAAGALKQADAAGAGAPVLVEN